MRAEPLPIGCGDAELTLVPGPQGPEVMTVEFKLNALFRPG